MTILIAGLRKNQDQEDIDGVPYLARIPFVNLLFSKRDRHQYSTEIIIFLTPHIIKGESMMAWDKEKMKDYPKRVRPENKEYLEPELKRRSLKEAK